MAVRASALVMMMLLTTAAGVRAAASDGLMDRLTSGMKFAQDFLGSESVALKVAEFVVRAFQTANKLPLKKRPIDFGGSQQDRYDSRPSSSPQQEDTEVGEVPSSFSGLRQLVKLFGLQPKQISAVAVNALLFVAQMISSFLSGPRHTSQHYRIADPTTWILNKQSSDLQALLASAKNDTLPDVIEQLIRERAPTEETSCIRLLVCKITPFVHKMQKTVFGPDELYQKNAGGMYSHLPDPNDISKRSEYCETKHSDCDLNEY